MDLKQQLQQILKGEVSDDETLLNTFSKDASIFEIKPKLVVHPQGSEDIKSLVKFVNSNPEENLSLTPRSAGTDMSGGPLNDSIILDMTTHFNKVLEVGDSSAITQPGVFYRDFEVETLKKDLILPCYTASREICTVGGMVANNSAGEKTLSYGQTEKYVQKLKMVLSDGNEYTFESLSKTQLDKKLSQKDFEGKIYNHLFKLIEDNYDLIKSAKPQTHKNSAGYYLWNVWDKNTFDINKLLVGSQGTLGVITEIEFKLVKPQKHSKLLVIFLEDLKLLGNIVDEVLTQNPESFEVYDNYTQKYAMRFLPEILKVLKPKNFFRAFYQFLPEILMSITGKFPKLVLIAQFTGDDENVLYQKCLDTQILLKKFGVKTKITGSEEEAKKYWVVRRESFSLLRHHSNNLKTAPFIDDFVVNPNHLPEFLPKLYQILDEYKLIYTVAGHIGDGNFHIIPLVDFSNPKTKEVILEISKRVFDLVFEYKGSMTGEHNDGLIRGPFLPQMYGEEIYQLFKEVKEIFDPKGIFNPHKKAEATFKYSYSHLTQTQKIPHSS